MEDFSKNKKLATNWGLTVIVLVSLIVGVQRIPGSGMLSGNGLACYVLNLASIVGSLCVIYFGLKIFKNKRVLKQITESEDLQARAAYGRWSNRVLAFLYGCAVFDFVSSYLQNDLSSMWCALTVCVASFFCIPTEGKYNQLRKTEKQNEDETISNHR